MSGELVFGLDLGINNVGWCALRRFEKSVEIEALGTFVFDSLLTDNTDPSKGTKSADRGTKRRSRRTLERRHVRKMALYRRLAELEMLPSNSVERTTLLCRNSINGVESHPYALRARGLNEALTPYELGRALCHLNQRRGFLSPRDLMLLGVIRLDFQTEDPEDEESGQILGEIGETKKAIDASNCRTIGEFLYQRLSRGEPVRKKKVKSGKPADQKKEDLRRFVRANRTMIESEFDLIVARQRQYHPLLTDSVIAELKRIIFFQSPMEADEGTRGKCTFFPDELRAPRAGFAAQRFVLVQDLANLEIMQSLFDQQRKLTQEERKKLLEALMEREELKWAEVKDLLGLLPSTQFNIEPDGKRKKGQSGKKETLKGSKTVAALKACIPELWDQLGAQAQRDLVGEIISTRDWISERKAGDTPRMERDTRPAAARRYDLFLKKEYGPNKVRFNQKEAAALATVTLPKGYLNLSVKAIRKLIPNMLNGMTYDEACAAIGLNHAIPTVTEHGLEKLPYPSEKDIQHPLVRCSVHNAIRVLNALRWAYGQPDRINIELPRDLAKNKEQRLKDEKRIQENEKTRTRIMKEILAVKQPINETNIKKVRLWEEAGGRLPYEPDVQVSSIADLLKGDYQIDHIIPRSMNYDNSFGNLALCTADFNIHTKGNRILFDAIGKSNPERWSQIESHVRSLKSMPEHKKQRILAKEDPEGGFTGRHLATIGYISSQVLALAQRMVTTDTHAIVVQGGATADLRRLWGLSDLIERHPEEQSKWDEYRKRLELSRDGELAEDQVPEKPKEKMRSNFLHHAVDALVVALTDRKSLKDVTDYYKWKDSVNSGKQSDDEKQVQRRAAMPDPDLRTKALVALNDAHVVHRPHRKASGELHKQMPQTDGIPKDVTGDPRSRKVMKGHLVHFDHEGQPAQAYPLANNHHVVIWERTEPNSKGEMERFAEVVPMIEAVRRRSKREPVIRKHNPQPGWRFVMSLCKGDTVEMRDGRLAVVSKFNAKAKEGDAVIVLWLPIVAKQEGMINADNPYVVAYVQTAGRLNSLSSRIIQDPLGHVVFREGLDE